MKMSGLQVLPSGRMMLVLSSIKCQIRHPFLSWGPMKLNLNRDFLLKLLFFSSGFSCLTLQIAWQRILGQVVGIDYFSTIIIVSIFMLGLGLGGILGAQISQKLRRPLIFFIYAEMAIACFAVFSDSLLRAAALFSTRLGSIDLSQTSLMIDFGVYLALLIVPITLMGTSLPIVVQSAKRGSSAGVSVGRLYALNIAGACVGTFISGFFLVGLFGLKKTMIFAAILNLIIALLTLLSVRASSQASSEQKSKVEPPGLGTQNTYWTPHALKYFSLSFVVGFLAIGYQILYFRNYVYYFGATSYVFPMVLMIYLFYLWMGTSRSAFNLESTNPATVLRDSFSKILLSTSIIFILPYVLNWAGHPAPDSTNISPTRAVESLLMGALVTLFTLVPVRYLSKIFPALVQLLSKDQDQLGKRTGEVYVVQTFGNTLGAFATGAFLIPFFGTTLTAQFFLVSILILFLIFLRATDPEAFKKPKSYVYLFASLLILAFMSPKFFQQFKHGVSADGSTAPPSRIYEEHEATTFVYENAEKNHAIIIAGEGATSFNYQNGEVNIWPMDVAMAALARPPKKILIIGFGTGMQALGIHLLYPKAEIVVVELLHTVIDEVEKFGSPDLKELLLSSKVIVSDGTRFVNKRSGQGENFDIVQIGVFRITASSSGNLFTTEFFIKLKSILSPDGVISGNANVNSVGSAMHAYKNVIVAARSEGEISDFIATDNPSFAWSQFSQSYATKLQELQSRAQSKELDSVSSQRLRFTPPEKAFFVLKPETLTRALIGFPEQTNDLIASENFLMNKTYFYKFKDTRRWPKEFADVSLLSDLPQLFKKF